MIKSVAAVIFTVSDLEQACRFYQDKLGMKLTYKNDKTSWAEFDLNGVRFSLTKKQPYGHGDNPMISLYVDSLERSVEAFKENGVQFPGNGEIKTEFFGKHVQIQDPDGNTITLYER